MDLRKKLLLKVPLAEVSMNSSQGSVYESAGEDSDSDSMYFSFSNSKDFDMELDHSQNENKSPKDHDITFGSDPDNKNDTVIMVDIEKREEKVEIKGEIEERSQNKSEAISSSSEETSPLLNQLIDVKEALPPVVNVVKDEIVQEKAVGNANEAETQEISSDKKVQKAVKEEPITIVESVPETQPNSTLQIPETAEASANEATQQVPNEIIIDAGISSVQIIIRDPNENRVNPFTLEQAMSPIPSTSGAVSSKSGKKSLSKIPTLNSHFYSPLQRASIDRKTTVVIRPTGAVRRTIYETRQATTEEATAGPSKSSVEKAKTTQLIKPATLKSKSATSILQPKGKKETVPTKAKVAAIQSKPKAVPAPAKTYKFPAPFKCTFDKCSLTFRSSVAFQDHLKSHQKSAANSTMGSSSSLSTSASSQSSFKCKWCDKTFSLPNALTNHLLESCKKIPYPERRKLLAEEDNKQATTNKRKSIFVAPEPIPRKSPRRRTIVSRKSGVVTPKKSLKCSVENCGQIFTDVLSFAQHTMSHKYNGVLTQVPSN